jgi:hypothetical protein
MVFGSHRNKVLTEMSRNFEYYQLSSGKGLSKKRYFKNKYKCMKKSTNGIKKNLVASPK